LIKCRKDKYQNNRAAILEQDTIRSINKGGAIKFKDTKTDTSITIQNSEVKKISKKEYKSALEAKEFYETKEVK
jgi:hypothetical protein